MRIKYIRTSTLGQCTSRQEVNSNEFDRVFIDQVSGTIPFFEREKGKLILEIMEEGITKIESITVDNIDRLGRNLQSTLQTIERFTQQNIPVIIESLGISTINPKTGKTDYTINLLISVMSMFAELELSIRKESQAAGILQAKLKGKYHGRRPNTRESVTKFLNKSKNKRALELIESESKMSQREIALATGLHVNSVRKILKVHKQFHLNKETE